MDLTPTETTETNNAAEQHPEAAHTHAHDHDHDHTHQHGPTLNPELTKEISVEVEADEVSKAFKNVVKRYQKLARIPGFRAGKVPESLVRSKFAKEVRQEVLETLVSERFRKAIDEQKLSPISQPQLLDLQLHDGEPLRFKAAFEVAPEFSVDGYDNVKIARPDVTLTEDEYQAELSRVLDSHATVETVEEDRPLVDGDWAEIQFKGEVKDLAQTVTEEGAENASKTEPITGEDVLVEIGGKNTLPAFNDALRGTKPGQEMSFEVAYPAEFGEPRLAGQTVAYDVTVKAIKRKTYPERDAEFAKQLGNYETWDDFEAKLREMAADRKKSALESQTRDKMLDELVQKFQFPIPESFVQQQVDARLDRGLRALAQQGMSAEEMRRLDFERLRAAQRDQALNEVKASMILDKIGEAEKVTINEEDLDRELLMLSLQSREPLETLRDRLAKDGGLDRIREQMRREKTASVLYEKLAS
ncbi:trigger factor [Edaphobacter albus]|uniref:trigger factor n=1 Tax=Edaphobacter sp. 4G125 TaxID=2763071 RepID=UPI0016453199|nr:trigger factor [Edaphobacter sp. 4G125]QNI35407.1 trigger factor [Edaphobacter sp. 4G125]